MTKIRGKIQQVPIGRVVENPWNYNRQTEEMFEKQRASIKRHGFLGVTIVREIEDAGQKFYQIIDGAHRFRAMKQDGATHLRVDNLGTIKDAEAKKLTLMLREVRGSKQKGMFESLLDELGIELSEDEMSDLPVPDALITKLEKESKEAEDAMVDIDFDPDSSASSAGDDDFMAGLPPATGSKPKGGSTPDVHPKQATVTLHFSEEDWEEKGQGILKKIESVCNKAGGYAENA